MEAVRCEGLDRPDCGVMGTQEGAVEKLRADEALESWLPKLLLKSSSSYSNVMSTL